MRTPEGRGSPCVPLLLVEAAKPGVTVPQRILGLYFTEKVDALLEVGSCLVRAGFQEGLSEEPVSLTKIASGSGPLREIQEVLGSLSCLVELPHQQIPFAEELQSQQLPHSVTHTSINREESFQNL